MSHTELCPVCEGAGIVNREQLNGAVVELNIKCYGCLGKGWVVAPGDKRESGPPGLITAEPGERIVKKTPTRTVK